MHSALPKKMKNTPEFITELPEGYIFVFGSNTEGIHGSGSARTAVEKFGAIQGIPTGLQGKSYGIITKDFKYYGIPLDVNYKKIMLRLIKSQILTLYDFAKFRDDKRFVVTKIGCGLAGFTETEIGDCFRFYANIKPKNIILPTEFE